VRHVDYHLNLIYESNLYIVIYRYKLFSENTNESFIASCYEFILCFNCEMLFSSLQSSLINPATSVPGPNWLDSEAAGLVEHADYLIIHDELYPLSLLYIYIMFMYIIHNTSHCT